ncbi:hypothetical protein BJ170DRAFT_599273 [Xylariales sp. AK1849]|nr:hypothetical protein BJ170DRAFT_599273 [Xylariales sp. AK1849]
MAKSLIRKAAHCGVGQFESRRSLIEEPGRLLPNSDAARFGSRDVESEFANRRHNTKVSSLRSPRRRLLGPSHSIVYYSTYLPFEFERVQGCVKHWVRGNRSPCCRRPTGSPGLIFLSLILEAPKTAARSLRRNPHRSLQNVFPEYSSSHRLQESPMVLTYISSPGLYVDGVEDEAFMEHRERFLGERFGNPDWFNSIFADAVGRAEAHCRRQPLGVGGIRGFTAQTMEDHKRAALRV